MLMWHTKRDHTLTPEEVIMNGQVIQWCTEGGGGGGGCSTPPPEIPKALHNRAKLAPIVKTVKICWI